MNIRVLVIDDHPVVLEGMTSALARQADIEVVGGATSLAEALTFLGEHEVDVALVDIRLPDGSGFELLRSIDHSRLACVVISSFDTPQYADTALQLGAAGYLLKTAPLEEVVQVIRRAAAGVTSFSRRHVQRGGRTGSPSLSARDLGIVRRLLAGRSNDEIAKDLDISRKTVERHLTRLYETLGVSSRAELAARAEREGWSFLPARDRELT